MRFYINVETTDGKEVDINPENIAAVEDGLAPSTCTVYLQSGFMFKAALSRKEFIGFLGKLYNAIDNQETKPIPGYDKVYGGCAIIGGSK